MPDFLPVPTRQPGPLDHAFAAARLLEAFLAGRNERTRRAYRQDVADFAAFCGAGSPEEAARLLLAEGPGPANLLALNYRAHLRERGLSAATVNRRLAALRSLVKLGRTLGMVSWQLEVEGLKAEPYRDTRGPGREGFRRLLNAIPDVDTPKGRRDRAVLRLLYDLGLRRAEVCGLDVGDYDRATGTIAVLGKGRTQKAALTLPRPTAEALEAWLAVRPEGGEALFVSLSRFRPGHRLTGNAVYELVRGLGKRAGLVTRPHGLRHASITEALDMGMDLRSVQRFSRHKNLATLQKYDDNREDLGGQVARRLAEEAA
jgi:integrase/recombinase XerC